MSRVRESTDRGPTFCDLGDTPLEALSADFSRRMNDIEISLSQGSRPESANPGTSTQTLDAVRETLETDKNPYILC
jgi:hypothetical protein